DGNGGQRGCKCVGECEPAHISRHLLAVDRLDGELRMRERRNRSRRADQHVALVEELEVAVVDLGLLDIGPRNIAERVLQTALSVVDDIGTEQIAMLLETLTMRADEYDTTKDLESLVYVGEVGMTIARLGKDRAECARALLEDRGDIGIDWAAAEIGRASCRGRV